MRSSFGFLASAAGVGGSFTRPFQEPLPVQAASMLPSVGGYGSSRVEQFRFHDLLSFKAAYTLVMGSEYVKNGKRERATLALGVVEGLNVLDMVTADRVVGRLVSETVLTHDGVAQPAEVQDPTWLPAGSYFENLRIGGRLIEPRPHKRLADWATLKAGRQALEPPKLVPSLEPPTLAPSVEAKDAAGQEKDKKDYTYLSTCEAVASLPAARQGNPLRCSMFEHDEKDETGDHHYTIAGFGEVFLGEYVVGTGFRKLTMIRLALGCPAEGDVGVVSLQGNGSPY